MTWLLTFTVPGRPVGQGSKRAMVSKHGKPFVMESGGERLRAWRTEVRETAIRAMDMAGYVSGLPLDGPITLGVLFVRRRPRGHFTKRGLRVDAPTWVAGPPDLSKLVRGLEDALTGIVWHDDAQVVQYQTLEKQWGDADATKVWIGRPDAQAVRPDAQ